MRIAAVYDRFVRGGGLENYLSDLVSQFLLDGHEVDVITSRTDPETAASGARIKKLRRSGLTARSRLRSFDSSAAEAVRELQPDVSIGFGRTTTHDVHRAGGGCHKMYSDHVLPLTRRFRAKNRAELALERALYTSGRTRHFVCNSQMVADQITDTYQIAPERISVIHTAVDSQRFHPDPTATVRKEICAELRTDPEVPVFLVVSLGHRRKGLETILRAWRNIDAHLWIVGSRFSSSHLKQIERSGINQRVFHLGLTQNTAPFYQAADFFLHPTRYDACANTVLQSMASGLPGLISIRDGAHEFVTPSETGLLITQPENPEELVAVVESALSLNAQEKTAMGEAARQRVLHLTWDYHVDSWMTLIQRVLKS